MMKYLIILVSISKKQIDKNNLLLRHRRERFKLILFFLQASFYIERANQKDNSMRSPIEVKFEYET